MKRNLIVARSGNKSLHPHWLTGAEPDFDLVVTYYGEDIPEEWIDQGYPIVRIKGPKWRGLYEYFTANAHWKAYDRILLPDDDLMFDAALINRFFVLVSQYEPDLSQPALDKKSFFSHPITLASQSFACRVTNFVEIMCPCMSPRLLEMTLPLFPESASGWGMEFHWARLLAESDMKLPMIFDSTPITHTRPVGQANSGTDSDVRPTDEIQSFFKKHGLVDEKRVTLAGVLTSGEVIDGVKSRDRLAPHLVRDAVAMNEQLGQPRLAWFIDTIAAEIDGVAFPWLRNRKTDAVLQLTPEVSSRGPTSPPSATVASGAKVLAEILENGASRELFVKSVSSIVHENVFGRGYDSYNIDSLAFFAAGISASEYAVANMAEAKRFQSAASLRDYAVQCAPPSGMVLEFGVFSGGSINRMAAQLPEKHIYGFDSFEGLPETWRPGFEKGAFRCTKLPEVRENVELIVGWFNQTLPGFIEKHQGEPLALLHVDCDLYSSTKTILSLLANCVVAGTIIVFDEYINYPSWRLHEYRAFQEFTTYKKVKYEYIGVVPSHQQVAVRILEVG